MGKIMKIMAGWRFFRSSFSWFWVWRSWSIMKRLKHVQIETETKVRPRKSQAALFWSNSIQHLILLIALRSGHQVPWTTWFLQPHGADGWSSSSIGTQATQTALGLTRNNHRLFATDVFLRWVLVNSGPMRREEKLFFLADQRLIRELTPIRTKVKSKLASV